MESKIWLLITGYNLIFFKDFLLAPWKFATGELLSTFFPHWIWIGRKLRKRETWLKDRIYYQYPGAIPFLSSFYPPHLLTAFLSTFLSLDNSFRLKLLELQAHYLLSSILSYFLFLQWTSPELALFGAITLTYAAYMIKVNNPCCIYSMAWMPGILLPGPLSGISLGMALLGGYWPTLILFAPFAIIAHIFWYGTFWPFVGFLIAIPQIIAFLWYLPRSVRSRGSTGNPGGKVPFWRFLDLIIPNQVRSTVDGVFWPESALFIGWIPLLFIPFSHSMAWFTLALAGFGMLGFWVVPFSRIPARWSHLFSFSLVWLAVDGLTRSHITVTALWGLILLQAASLLVNNKTYPMWPFTEWWKRPSQWWDVKLSLKTSIGRVPNLRFPYFTGYVDETRTLGYTGGFALQALCDFHGVWNERVKTSENKEFLSGSFKGDILEELERRYI